MRSLGWFQANLIKKHAKSTNRNGLRFQAAKEPSAQIKASKERICVAEQDKSLKKRVFAKINSCYDIPSPEEEP
jgi:hypothetical protein